MLRKRRASAPWVRSVGGFEVWRSDGGSGGREIEEASAVVSMLVEESVNVWFAIVTLVVVMMLILNL